MKGRAEPVLDAQRIVAGYEPDLPILNGASLAVAAGEIVAVLGPNGAGKSTLVKVLGGLVPVTSGTIRLGDRDITRAPAHARVRQGLAFVPQTENVFASMTVEDNLRLATDCLPDRGAAARQIGAMFDLFPDLARQRKLLAGRLSGGQRQMLAVARAWTLSPRVIVLDEPSAGLSPRLVGEVFAQVAAVRRTGVAVVLVEQNVRAALAIADRAVVMVEGRDRHEAPAGGLADDPILAALFLGHRGRDLEIRR